MALQPKFESEGITMTEADYLKFEQVSDIRHEFINGRVYAMTGATTNHSRITGNIFGEFRNHLKGKPCEAFMSDMKAKVAKNYFYPDVTVVCNHQGLDGITDQPVMIVEVLSKSTRKLDLTIKLIHYLNLASLQEYVLIEQDIVRVQVFRRKHAWQVEEYSLGDFITFESIDVTLAIEDIYERVDNHEINEFRQEKFNTGRSI